VVLRWHNVVRRALEYIEMRSFLRDQRDRLHSGGARSDDADSLIGEVDLAVRPKPCVIDRTLEVIVARKARRDCRRKATDGHDEEARADALSSRRLHNPLVGSLVERSGDDARV